MSLADLRREYSHASLSEDDVAPDPVVQFGKWFEEALAAKVFEPNAMCLSTVAPDGRPSARIVLIKGFDVHGFVWYTNYDSRKGQELRDNPHAALLFYWRELERQVRIEGSVEPTSDAESDAYFASRPLQSRLSAIASDQSRAVADRRTLEQRFAQAQERYGEHPARPGHWGGHRLKPERIEFWQGRESRLHDRIVYVKQADGGWKRERLQP